MPLTKRQSEALYILHKYTYIKLMGEAIEKQDSRCVTLHEIYEYLRQKDAFFRGEYVGWKNYVCDTLSVGHLWTYGPNFKSSIEEMEKSISELAT
uniref:Fork-head domain-containing protein n=1 Tax=Meloidogyne floridensis TaxID=298350 RepID=A0A915P8Y2_9BILA